MLDLWVTGVNSLCTIWWGFVIAFGTGLLLEVVAAIGRAWNAWAVYQARWSVHTSGGWGPCSILNSAALRTVSHPMSQKLNCNGSKKYLYLSYEISSV